MYPESGVELQAAKRYLKENPKQSAAAEEQVLNLNTFYTVEQGSDSGSSHLQLGTCSHM